MSKSSVSARPTVPKPVPPESSRDPHLRRDSIEDLVRKIVEALSVDEKITWSWGVITECQYLTATATAQSHLEECPHCHAFLRSRKSLAEQIIKAGRV
jgi:hypothetical protein